MNERSKKKRQERVRKQKILQREANTQKRKKKKEEWQEEQEQRRYFAKVSRERLQYAKDLQEPDIKEDDSALERNIKVLEAAIAEHEALIKYREGHKEEVDKLYGEAQKQQKEYAKEFENTTVGFAPSPEET